MSFFLKTWLLVIALSVSLPADALLAEETKLTALLRRSPSTANSVGYLHVPSLKRLMANENISSEMSDRVDEVWLISDLDAVSLTHSWEAGYATMNQDIDPPTLALAMGGYIDYLVGKQVIWTPRQSYLVPLGEKGLGFLRPAKRALLSDWLEASQRDDISAYLQKQAKQPEQYLSLLISINLRNTFSPIAIAKKITDLESAKALDPRQTAELLASVQGLSVIVGRRNLNECIVSVEFVEPPTSLVPQAASILAEILNRNGTSTPEVATWKVSEEANTLSFQGAISADSLHGILGIFSLQGQADQVASSLDQSSRPNQEGGVDKAAGYEAKKYFDQVNAQVERVRSQSAQTSGIRAKWNDQQARRIDELSTLNVDPLLIDFGTNVASLLRGNALTIRTGNISAGQVKASQSLSSGYYAGYYDFNSSADYQRVTEAASRGAASADFRTTMSTIDKMTGDVRREMTQKFNMPF